MLLLQLRNPVVRFIWLRNRFTERSTLKSI